MIIKLLVKRSHLPNKMDSLNQKCTALSIFRRNTRQVDPSLARRAITARVKYLDDYAKQLIEQAIEQFGQGADVAIIDYSATTSYKNIGCVCSFIEYKYGFKHCHYTSKEISIPLPRNLDWPWSFEDEIYFRVDGEKQ